MSRHSLGIVTFALLTLLAGPREATANLIDIIWEMSGPQLFGTGITCRIGFDGELEECRVIGLKFAGTGNASRFRLRLDGTILWSTGKNSNANYEFAKVRMLGFDPMLEVRSAESGDVAVYHGVGVSYNALFGGDFSTFDKFGIKFQPLSVLLFSRVELGHSVKLYVNGSTADEFGFGRRRDVNRPFEFVHGLDFTIRWGQ